MAHANKVSRSIESPDSTRCVDIIRRSDGSFGFAEYRRDPEDPRGWSPIGADAKTRYPTEAAALAEARRHVHWLVAVLG